MSPFWYSPEPTALELTGIVFAFVSLRCVAHHKKTHLHGIVVIAHRRNADIAPSSVQLAGRFLSKLWLQLLRLDANFGKHDGNRAEKEIRDSTAPQRCADRELDTDGNCQPRCKHSGDSVDCPEPGGGALIDVVDDLHSCRKAKPHEHAGWNNRQKRYHRAHG